MPSGSLQTPAHQKLGGALCPSQPAQSLGTLLRIRQGAHISSPPGVCFMPAQQYFKLPTRVTVALSKELPIPLAWEPPAFFSPVRFRSPSLTLSLCPKKPQDSGRGGGEGRKADTLHKQPLPCATPQWLFLWQAPSRQHSPSPVHSGCSELYDLPREQQRVLGRHVARINLAAKNGF